MGGFGDGVKDLARGFAYWGRRPGAMALGIVPAVIVASVFAAALVALVIAAPGIATTVTPFADGWAPVWATLLRIGVGVATVGGALVLTAVTFTAVTLIVGEPFYDRIWRVVEADAGGEVPAHGPGFWRSVGDGVVLVARGLGVAVIAWAVGLVPVVGGVAGAVLGVVLTGRLLADELSSRALSARGHDRTARRRLLRAGRARALGFGVATQLCFLVPLGAVFAMPAAVAGSTLLARRLVELSPASSAPRAAPAPPG